PVNCRCVRGDARPTLSCTKLPWPSALRRPNELKAVDTGAPPVADGAEETPVPPNPNVPFIPSIVQPLNCFDVFLNVTVVPVAVPVCVRSTSLAFCTTTPSKVALA